MRALLNIAYSLPKNIKTALFTKIFIYIPAIVKFFINTFNALVLSLHQAALSLFPFSEWQIEHSSSRDCVSVCGGVGVGRGVACWR